MFSCCLLQRPKPVFLSANSLYRVRIYQDSAFNYRPRSRYHSVERPTQDHNSIIPLWNSWMECPKRSFQTDSKFKCKHYFGNLLHWKTQKSCSIITQIGQGRSRLLSIPINLAWSSQNYETDRGNINWLLKGGNESSN